MRIFGLGFLFVLALNAGVCFGGEGHYNGPMDVNAHSWGRVNDGSGEYFSIHELEAPHTVQGYAPRRGGWRHGYSRPQPYVVSHDGELALPAPPSGHMGREQYERWLEHQVPDLHDMPLGKRLRLEWEATGGWDNPRNYQPRR